MQLSAAETFIVVYTTILLVNGAVSTYLLLYTLLWPKLRDTAVHPDEYLPPIVGFTCLLPARNEQGVIAATIERLCAAEYPEELLEVIVLLEHDDLSTIAEAERAARGHRNVRVVTLIAERPSKPHSMNAALRESKHEIVTIFDSEDDVQPQLFRAIGTIFQRDNPDVVQGTCQLMDYRSSWYAVQNVIEYYYWFRSRQHFHARIGAIPLGGNTVFMRRDLLESIGGWDESMLTEDADIGMRLCRAGARTVVTFDAPQATREETPSSLSRFIRQRTRWSQGFLQVLRKDDWRKLPTLGQRLLAGYTLSYPLQQVCVALLFVPSIIAALHLSPALSVYVTLPLFCIVLHYAYTLVGLFEYGRLYRVPVSPRDVLVLTAGFLPYHFVLGLSSARALLRELFGRRNWEKTMHFGAHRYGPKKSGFEYVAPSGKPDARHVAAVAEVHGRSDTRPFVAATSAAEERE